MLFYKSFGAMMPVLFVRTNPCVTDLRRREGSVLALKTWDYDRAMHASSSENDVLNPHSVGSVVL